MSSNDNSNFEEYYQKIQRRQSKEDLKKLERYYKIRLYEYIPVFGAFIYILRVSFHLAGVKGGKFKQNLFVHSIIYLICTFFYAGVYLLLIFPVIYYWIIKQSISKTKKDFENDTFD